MKDCECFNDKCIICCMINGKCKPILPKVYKFIGQSCNNNLGFCDSNLVCRQGKQPSTRSSISWVDTINNILLKNNNNNEYITNKFMNKLKKYWIYIIPSVTIILLILSSINNNYFLKNNLINQLINKEDNVKDTLSKRPININVLKEFDHLTRNLTCQLGNKIININQDFQQIMLLIESKRIFMINDKVIERIHTLFSHIISSDRISEDIKRFPSERLLIEYYLIGTCKKMITEFLSK